MIEKSRTPEVYKNSSEPKGLALIINNVNFRTMGPRKGTNTDNANIRKLLKGLGYKVLDTLVDLRGKEMLDKATRFATDPRHASYDSCIVVVLTYGMQNTLVGTDEESVDTHEFVSCFHTTKAPLLARKPKIFIFQACRGDKYDDGAVADSVADHFRKLIRWFRLAKRAPAQGRTQTMQSGSPDAHKWPECSDVLIAHATPLNYVSWRNETNGSWFIQEICNVFGKHAASKNILELLTMVHEEVAKKYITYSFDCRKCGGGPCVGHKQIPTNENTFTKLFYFFPGATSENAPTNSSSP